MHHVVAGWFLAALVLFSAAAQTVQPPDGPFFQLNPCSVAEDRC